MDWWRDISIALALAGLLGASIVVTQPLSATSGAATENPLTPVTASASRGGCRSSTNELLDRMTDEQLVGQMVMAGVEPTSAGLPAEHVRRLVQDYGVGSLDVLSASDPAQAARFNNQAQAWAAESDTGIPLLVGADFEFGVGHTLASGATVLPQQMGLGATRDLADVTTAARITARQAKAMGFNWVFAPVADVNTEPANPAIGVRSFGEDPSMVSEMVAAAVRAYQGSGVMAAPKHFPGHGGTSVDSHLGLPTVSYDDSTLESIHLAPFQAAIDAGADSVMTGHLIVEAIDDAEAATLSEPILTGVLRNEMGYDGIVLTDAMNMAAITERYTTAEAATRAAQAGADIIMSIGTFDEHVATVQGLLEALRSGEIARSQVARSAGRVLRAKCRYGLFEAGPADPDTAAAVVGSRTDDELARELAGHSITLISNNGVLPLDGGGGTVMVTGVAEVRALAAGIDRSSNAEVIAYQTADEPRDVDLERVVQMADSAERVVVTTSTVASPSSAQMALVEALVSTGKPVVAVSLGVPYDSASYPEGVDAVIAAYAQGPWPHRDPTAVEAAAAVLTGEEPVGTLPVTAGEAYPLGTGFGY